MKFMKLIDLINKAANDYEKTKEEKYKKKWYKLINEYSRNTAGKQSRAVRLVKMNISKEMKKYRLKK